MKRLLSALCILLCFSTAFLSAESQIAKDAKTAIKKYAGYSELKKRGFRTKQLNKIQTAEDFYNVLLPYMIQDNKPLDNLITINGMNFARHKNIVFDDIYGKKEQLLKKGYSEDQLFYYPAAGKDMYRVGHFEWGQVPENPSVWDDVYFYRRPFMTEETAYFQVLLTSEKMFEPYYTELASKENIILDFRMYCGGWGGQLQKLGMYLEDKKYKGKIILITDRTTKNDFVFAHEIKTGAWNNGVQAKGSLNWYILGENTFGVQKYFMNPDWNYKTETLWFSPLPINTNKYAVCEEGVGITPDAWAIGDEDILKTLEFLTGDKTIRPLVKGPFDFHNKLSGNKEFFHNDNWQIPTQISQCTNNDEYNSLITEWLETKISWADFRKENQDALNNIYGWGVDVPECFQKIEDAKVYNETFAEWTETRTTWTRFVAENSETLRSIGYWAWGFDLPECLKTIKDPKEYNEAFAKWLETRTTWTRFIAENSETLSNIGYWAWGFDLPECLKTIKDPKEYNEAFAKWLETRTTWTRFIVENLEALKNTGGWNCDIPVCFKTIKDPKEYNQVFAEWTETRITWERFVAENSETLRSIDYWAWGFDLPECLKTIKDPKEYNETFAKWMETRTSWTRFIAENSEALNSTGGWNFDFPECLKTIKDHKEYNEAFAEWMETKTAWARFIAENSESLRNIGGWWFATPECFQKIKDAKEFNEAFAKWMETRTAWAGFIAENSEALNSTGGWWLDNPESLAQINNPQDYLSAFKNWIDLKTWWTLFIMDHQTVLKKNYLRIYKNDLDELFPDRTDPDKYIAQLDAYLKEQSRWMDFLMPHEYVIPASYEKAKKYKGLSPKIGKGCSAVPANIRDLQKTNPEEYVNQMVSYINRVAENDFEKVQMVFSIEQEILKYDNTERDKRVEKINIAKQGVGEDYDKYSENLNRLWKESGEEAKKQDWKTVLEEGICVCDGYSQLMQWFCYKLGLKCDRLFTPKDMYFAEGHAWNVVQIEGEDYLQDATWGLNYLYLEPDNFYFWGHFPSEPEEQLLKEPHTLEEFKALRN